MNIFQLSRIELSDLLKNRFLRLAILVVTIIPLLYGVLYLWAFWNPYGKLDNLPVAVVNEDLGAKSNDKVVNFGSDLIGNLKSNQVLKWDFVSADEAKNGLQKHQYFAEIRIPSDFSSNIISASTADPKQATLIFTAREANSMIGAQLSNRVASQISENLSHEISKNYLDNIFVQTRQSAEDIEKAAAGTEQLSNGLKEASDGTSQLSSGAENAYAGSSSLSLAINQIILGDRDLNSGINKNLEGSKNLYNGISQSATGAKSLVSGSSQLQSGIASIGTGTNLLIGNLSQINSSLTLAQGYLADPNTIINDPASPFNGLSKLQAANMIVSGILAENNKPENKQQVATLQAGLSQLSDGGKSLDQGINSLSSDLNGQILPGSSDLAAGLGQLAVGSNSLNKGLNDVSDGSKKLSEGLSSVSIGTKDLGAGISSAHTGAETLGQNLSDGAKQALQNSDVALTQKLSPVLSNPVVLEDASIDKVGNYGTGFSPYFIPLALWVGSLVLFLVIKVNDKKDKVKEATKPMIFFASKFITLAKVGAMQAIILDLVLIFALGLRPNNYVFLFTFTILVSWCFLAILQLLVASFQDAGKFLGIVLLMLQLTSASGTYPVQTSPKFFQAINPYLPMTYAVSGLREIISGGNASNILASYLFILLFLAGFLSILLLLSNRIAKSKINLAV